MSEMVERVARAIVQADEQNGGPCWDYLMTMGKHAKELVYDQARAAIAAMREPTASMYCRGDEAIIEGLKEYPLNGETLSPARIAWYAMIDTAQL